MRGPNTVGPQLPHEHKPAGHAHSHGPSSHEARHATVAQLRTLMRALVLTLSYFAVEVVMGVWSGSLSLLADAGHKAGEGIVGESKRLRSHWLIA